MRYKSFDDLVKQTARMLRKEQTKSEEVLWQIVRDRKLLNIKFLRQHPITYNWEGKKRFLVADFYCHEARLIVELDGGAHIKRKDHDKARDRILTGMGIKVLRISNDDVIFNTKEVISSIAKRLPATGDIVPSLSKREE